MTLKLLNSFENDVNKTCISVANINNRFMALSDTQFIENKVQDEILESNECESVTSEVRLKAVFCFKIDFLYVGNYK